ncbi:GH92 family glycosyl hydrolase [Fluviicola taffensis]|uniref:Alpha-1,2-mannosidase n=1 Tax=Fluviicola taffensis (strain DSM 16823 / NCIMB 13979 / RW262) TaxID=755732 RepID=F2IHY2_FLUTR|nr:GH92 family glycosyl hydrolase [Fluviicola taffensis]AEA45941.1 alpha-1,2-mannosidase [Fluviicola taffensis DSM 16823]
MKYGIALALVIWTFSGFSQIQDLKRNSDVARERIIQSQLAKKVVNPTQYVNPFIGTGGHGHTFPGPVLPFGMVQVGPDTRYEGWDGCGGYHYSDSVIYGFSHTHLSGTGVPDYADVLIVPQQGKLNTIPGYKKAGGFGSKFQHAKERALPGSYHVELENGITADLTATLRCALHRYQFSSAKGKRYILIDLGYRDRVLEVSATKTSANSVIGKRVSEAWATRQHLYFSLETSIPFTKSKWIENKKDGTYLFLMEFPEGVKEISVRVGLSGTDETGATSNLKSELNTFDFDIIRARAAGAWTAELAKIEVESTNKTVLTNFYTALYHTYVHPSLWSDVDGKYRDFNNKIQQSSNSMYSVFSLWDTYRGANPLYTITQPEKTADFVESFFQQYKNTGLLPVWTLSNNETNCMIGYHSVSVITDAYLKGIPLKNPEELLEAMIASSTADQFGKKQYEETGFISANIQAESVSKTLEYAYDDWCISKFAEKLGKSEIAKKYQLRSANWMNLMHPETRFFQPRKDGIFLPYFKPNEVNHHFTEANGWQYSLAAPQHIQTLIDMHGGNEGMNDFLDSLFLGASKMSGREQADITGLIGQYAHGNEPSHHMAYAYNYCGSPEKTQLFVDSILKTFYTNNPDGLSGNEDCGQMSAWYVLSSMGFYPVAPGSPTYAIGRPIMDHVIIKGAKNFEVVTKNNSSENKFIQSITWNGAVYQKLYITHEMIVQGGILEITMSPNPNKELANYELDLRNEISPSFVPVPFFTASQTVFEGEMEVGIDVLFFEKGKVYYSLDGTKFQPFYKQGGKNILLTETTPVYAKVVREDGAESKVIKTVFTKYIRDKKITLSSEYANQYSGGGPQALVDGQKGTEEYRGTEWQGTFGKDVEGIIELNEAKEISQIQFSYLQDQRSWIFPPKSVAIEVSNDGVNFRKLGKTDGISVTEGEVLKIGEITVEIAPTTCKFIRFSVENYGPCPEWHLGAGNQTWLFLDEITIK